MFNISKFSLDLKNGSMRGFSFGRGERALVILPGLDVRFVSDSADGVASSYRIFAEDFKVYVFDRLTNPPAGYTLKDMSDDTVSALKLLGVSKADFFGASQGGMIAQYIAADYPSLVNSLILGSSASRLNDTSRAVMEHWLDCARRGDIGALNESFAEKLFSERFYLLYREFISHMLDNVTDEMLRRFIILGKACEGFDISGRLGDIQCPVFVIGAFGDKVLTSAESVYTAERLGCELYMYGDDYGHCVYDEAPDYRERMMTFLKKH